MIKTTLAAIVLLLISSICYGQDANYYNNIVGKEFNIGASASLGIKVITNIPVINQGSGSRRNITINVKGHDIANNVPIGLTVSTVLFDGPEFRTSSVSSINNYRPDVHLGVENGKMILLLASKNMKSHLTISALGSSSVAATFFQNWSIVNGDETNISSLTKVAYKNDPYGYDHVIYRRMWRAASGNPGTKIVTNIPDWTTGNRLDIAFKISGWNKTAGVPYELFIYWSKWKSTDFQALKMTTGSSYKPDVSIAFEDGKMVLWFDTENKPINQTFNISGFNSTYDNGTWWQGWDIKYEGLNNPGSATLIPYDNSGEGLWSMLEDNDINYTGGKVGIGVDAIPNDYSLAVSKGILAEKIKVELQADWQWPDYVFAEDYNLRTLEEVEEHIKAHKHLPGVPSAKEISQDGIDLGKTNAILLKKIEELTLYQIELKKELETLRKKIEEKE